MYTIQFFVVECYPVYFSMISSNLDLYLPHTSAIPSLPSCGSWSKHLEVDPGGATSPVAENPNLEFRQIPNIINSFICRSFATRWLIFKVFPITSWHKQVLCQQWCASKINYFPKHFLKIHFMWLSEVLALWQRKEWPLPPPKKYLFFGGGRGDT